MQKWLAVCGLVGFGYVLGASGVVDTVVARAQNEQTDTSAAAVNPSAASEDAQKKITAAFDALKAAREALEGESLYVPATTSLNAFGILSGGFNAIEDLESGRGVDPETFAALYADQATDEVKAKLTRDDKNRLVYNGKLIQMYNIARLRRTFDARAALAGDKANAAPKKKATEEATE